MHARYHNNGIMSTRRPKAVRYGIITMEEYNNVHHWVKHRLGKAMNCKICGKEGKNYEWSNISGEYRRELPDWRPLCKSCHKRIDCNGTTKTCGQGHELTSGNLYLYPDGGLECRTCRKTNRAIRYAKTKENT